MSILSFGKSARQKQQISASDWSNQEMADFFRAHRLLVRNGACIGMDRGLSDMGEPWLVFFDTTSQDAFLHIARIDGLCVLVCDNLGIRINASRIDGLINRFEEQVRHAFALRAERSSNVVMHPAAKIIMSISAVFLLFKLDSSSETFARESLGPLPEHGARKSDGSQLRLQASLARLLDGAETPAAMAALAGVILASDIALRQSGDADQSESVSALNLELSHEASLQLSSPAQFEEELAIQSRDLDILVLDGEETAKAKIALMSPLSVEMSVEVDRNGWALDSIAETVDLPNAHHQAPVPPVQSAAAELEATASTSEATAAVSSAPPVTTAADEPMSIQVLQTAAALDFNDLPVHDLTAGLMISDAGEISTLEFHATLPAATNFGFEAETHLNTDDLLPMLEHIISQLGAYELEVSGSVLSVMQIADKQDNLSILGMWTNVMSDGSSIAIVGAVDVIDDVRTLLTAA